ncbi:MAG: phosphoenolpyruvate--protein phosphotransferase [Clostridia bacterium]|nr:phosphoenolpyruvate--protein phosphotransferase [Clostridia bacterium]
MLKGIGASQGYGIGRAVIIDDTPLDYSGVRYTTPDGEKARLDRAVEDFTKETAQQIAALKDSAGEKEALILEGHLTMLQDPFMLSQMKENIDGGSVAEAAADAVCNMFIDMFSGVEDEMMRQRASDIKDIRDSLLKLLLGVNSVAIEKVPAGSILVAKDFTPSMTSRINKENVAAIVTEIGGVTSHSAILARAMEIPAALSVPDATRVIRDGDELVVDGFKGEVFPTPDESLKADYAARQEKYLKDKAALAAFFDKPAKTKSGVVKQVYGNIGKAQDVENVLQNGGEGIGLFRTEFLFMDRDTAPTEEEQFEAYAAVARAMGEREVIIRTLDIGGDKAIDYLSIEKEENPFLGHRAIRYCLDHEELFKTQLRALLRAAACGNVKIMLPLVTTVDEIRAAKALLAVCRAELEKEGKPFKDAPVGVMIETPSAALISDLMAKEAAFFSIGTNDLTGYTMAVDRGNAKVKGLYDVFQPSVLRAIEMTIKNAGAAGIPVGMCGEAAADPRLIPSLVEWGLDEFSVTPTSILQTKKNICDCE